MKRFLGYTYAYLALISLIGILIAFFNYHPGTWLMGWDVVMPELDIKLNLVRALNGVWQEYRGLGLLDGMAHTANLMHTLYVWVLSLVFPQSSLRYIFISLTHIVGGIGMFFLIRNILTNKKHAHTSLQNHIAATIASLFYMINIGVVQMYSAPLEVFAMHFAALPWMGLCILNTLHSPTRRNMLLLALTSLLTTPQGFVPTIFIAYLVLVFFLLVFSKKLKTSLIIMGILITTNAFWLMPYAYGIRSNAAIIQKTRINEFTSEEIYYRNKAYGDILNVLSLKGFMIDAVESSIKTNTYEYLNNSWRSYSNTPWYVVSYAAFFLTAMHGIYSAIRKRERALYPFILTGAVAFFFLANNTPIFAQLNALIRNVFPVLGEAFRFPFTKFIILLSFTLSVFVGYGVTTVSAVLKRIAPHSLRSATIIVFVFLFILSWPLWQGNFVSSFMKVPLPQGYLQMMQYLQTQDTNKRIGFLPIYSFWNWQHRLWGHRGSGFLWYGIPQPITERAFDPWSSYNEQFYNEFSHALLAQNQDQLTQVIQKYNLSYLLLDDSVRNNVSTKPINYEQLNRFLKSIPYIQVEKHFEPLTLYSLKLDAGSWVSTIDNAQNIVTNGQYSEYDIPYSQKTNYLSASSSEPTIAYPFSSLYSGKLQEDQKFAMTKKDGYFSLIPTLSSINFKSPPTIQIPSYFTTEHYVPFRFQLQNSTLVLTPVYPTLVVNKKEYKIDASDETISVNIANSLPLNRLTIINTDQPVKLGEIAYLEKDTENVLRIEGTTNSSLAVIKLASVAPQTRTITLPTTLITSLEIRIPTFANKLYDQSVIEKKDYEIKTSLEEFSTLRTPYSYARDTYDGTDVNLETRSNAIDLTFYKKDYDHRSGYLLIADIQHISGLPNHMYIDNSLEKRSELETRLSKTQPRNVILLPPSQPYHDGYGFHFITKSLGNEIAEQVISHIETTPFPYTWLRTIQIAASKQQSSSITPVSYSRLTPASYVLSFTPTSGDSTLTLSQSFHSGWIAYQATCHDKLCQPLNIFQQTLPNLFYPRLKDHVLVNNWANGWKIDLTQANKVPMRFILIFWPQHLQTLGLIILLATFVALAVLPLPKKTSNT